MINGLLCFVLELLEFAATLRLDFDVHDNGDDTQQTLELVRCQLELCAAQHRDAILDLGQWRCEKFLDPIADVRPIGGLKVVSREKEKIRSRERVSKGSV